MSDADPRIEGARLGSGEPVRLAPLLASAGEGAVYEVAGHPEWVAKIFHPTLNELPSKLDKVAAMVQSPPPGTVQPNGFVVLTWPTELVVGQSGPIGYVMPRIDTATSVEIHTMSNPVNRMDPLPSAPQWTRNADWNHLVNTAANLCLAVEVVHRVDAVIGDFQERNILVSDTTEVSLVDCDSMQFTDRSGQRYLCGVGRPEFTAPELAGHNLREFPREQTSDLFALAVHIHQLLMAGNHPFFRGTWTGSGEQPDALSLARIGNWAGGPNSQLRTHPLAPPIGFLPEEIQRMFVRAFTDGVQNPAARPSAAEWRAALLRIRLGRCGTGQHQIPAGAGCPWCAIDAERSARRGRQARALPPRMTVAGGRPPPALPQPVSNKAQLIVIGIWTAVAVVLILTVFIVWAILSGASSFGL
ncbi:hypothetical protein KV112_21845 [Mycolicibacter sp. MYC123]|uniref:Protein kinase domain-containing protein n=1 Tax=[Mycobacterium] zoologicum TaxID=2872311 RepID=A0ABU5YQI7_9MYCO|nr:MULTISPECIES: hypothetical protein [unclassified Mycolicibacter]MEB3052339.1 hypothetical protein [Mycolicibacter sp. MYC123]MEB3062219.1 hypothetical protein [Mycolicibacter sp. MYC101]